MRRYLQGGIILILMSLIISGCSNASSDSSEVKKNLVEDQLVLLMDQNEDYVGEGYLKKGFAEKEKIGLMKGDYNFLEEKNAIIFRNEEDKLYIQESGKEKELISSEPISYYTIAENEAGVFFFKEDSSDLYLKRWGMENEKIASGAHFAKGNLDLSVICYMDKDSNLYLKKQGQEKEKIGSGCKNFYISDDGNAIYYLDVNENLYFRDLQKPDNQKITTGIIEILGISEDGKNILYLNEFDYEKEMGELYLFNGSDNKKIASDVSNAYLILDNDKIYYRNIENNLLAYNILNESKEKISSDIENFDIIKKDKIIFKTIDGNIYIKESDKEKEYVANDVLNWVLRDGKIVYLTNENQLYIKEENKEKEKIASEVQNFVASTYGNVIVYLTNGNEVYMKYLNKEAKLLIENSFDYYRIYLSDRLIFEKSLRVQDIAGIWYSNDENAHSAIEITNENKLKAYLDGEMIGEVAFEVDKEGKSLNSFYINLLGEESLQQHSTVFISLQNQQSLYTSEMGAFYKISKEDFDKKMKQRKDEIALENKIREANEIGMKISGTYRIVSDSKANYRVSPNVDSALLGQLIQGSELYVYDTYVDEKGVLWCQVDAYNEYGYLEEGWTAYINLD